MLEYLDGFKPPRSILVVVDDGLVPTDHLTASTLTDHILWHKTNNKKRALVNKTN